MKKRTKAHILIVTAALVLTTRYIYADGLFSQKADEIVRTEAVHILNDSSGKWEYLGNCRITTFCPYCNEPQGHGSASGTYLEPGHAACGWLPLGTKIAIEGEIFEIVDVCGTDAIDIFIDSDDGCHCNLNTYKHVVIWKE